MHLAMESETRGMLTALSVAVAVTASRARGIRHCRARATTAAATAASARTAMTISVLAYTESKKTPGAGDSRTVTGSAAFTAQANTTLTTVAAQAPTSAGAKARRTGMQARENRGPGGRRQVVSARGASQSRVKPGSVSGIACTHCNGGQFKPLHCAQRRY